MAHTSYDARRDKCDQWWNKQARPAVADPAAALADLQDLKARSTTQFKDFYDGGDLVMDDMFQDGPQLDEDLAEYEPSLEGDADNEDVRMDPVPGAVLMYQRHAEERAAPVRRRLVSEEPDPENPEDAPPARPTSQACACRAGVSATGV